MFRMTMFFTADRNSWSESHVLTTTTGRIPAEAQALNIAKARAALLGTNARIVAVRLSDVGEARSAALIDMGAPTLEAPTFTNPQEGQTTADSPHVAVLVRANNLDSGGALHQSRMFLSGVPDQLITVRGSGPQLKTTPQWDTRFTAFRNALYAADAGFKITTQPAGGQVQGLVVSNVPPGEIGIRIDNFEAGQQVGDNVYLSRFVTATGFTRPLKGKYQISSIVKPVAPDTLQTFYLRGTGGIDPTSFAQLGIYRLKGTAYLAYTNVNVAGATHRDRGGSYGLQRGRSRTRQR